MVRVSAIVILILFSIFVTGYAIGGRRGEPISYGKMFNVMNYGAKPGGQKDNAQAFIQTWRVACDSPVQGTVLIPQGLFMLSEAVFAGPCKSDIPITFLLQGTIKAVSDPSAYSGKGWLNFEHMNGLTITGGGTINAQGKNMWEYNDCKKNSNCQHLTASIYMVGVKNVRIRSIHMVDSMGFHMHITRCNGVQIRGITITAPGDSPNTDGIHVSNGDDIRITRSIIGTGDDCISVGQGVTNMNVSKIQCGPGHGISIGSLGKYPNETPVKGILVTNCTLMGTTNGLRIKTYAGSTATSASKMIFNDIIVNNVQNPIIIDQNYGSNSKKPSQVKLSDITFQNIRGTTTSPVAVKLACSSQYPCQNVKLLNINLQSKSITPTATCINAQPGFSGVQIPAACHNSH